MIICPKVSYHWINFPPFMDQLPFLAHQFQQFDSGFIDPCVDIRRVGFLAACFGPGLPSGLMGGKDLCEDVKILWVYS